MVELIKKLKGDDVILTGGASTECLEDVFVAFKSFGVNVQINDKYVYSAETRSKDSINDSKRYIMKFNEFIIK